MRHPHAAADHHIVSYDLAAIFDRDKTKIVREHIDIVVRWQRHSDLEFSRHVGAAIDRLVLFLAARNLLSIDPDLMPSAALRQQMRSDRLRQSGHLGMGAALPRI